jgi:hypothetical protein
MNKIKRKLTMEEINTLTLPVECWNGDRKRTLLERHGSKFAVKFYNGSTGQFDSYGEAGLDYIFIHYSFETEAPKMMARYTVTTIDGGACFDTSSYYTEDGRWGTGSDISELFNDIDYKREKIQGTERPCTF